MATREDRTKGKGLTAHERRSLSTMPKARADRFPKPRFLTGRNPDRVPWRYSDPNRVDLHPTPGSVPKGRHWRRLNRCATR